MGKAAMCIEMLKILNSGRVYKVYELADLLETNPRNVIEYKKELEEAGYYIISIPGKYGGYKLDKTSLIPSLRFTEEEKKALTAGAGYLEARNDFLLKKDFQLAMSKVYSSLKHTEPQVEPLIINRFPLSMLGEEIVARYEAIEKCVIKQCKIEMEYMSLKGEAATRVFHPYRLFMYNNAWYTIGFDEKTNDIRYFKLNRIKNFKILSDQRFRRMLSYNESDYFDEFGMRGNGDWYKIKLQLFDQYATLVTERLYGKNQKVETLADGSAILTCEMQNKESIKVFVLGFGEHCKVLEPEWLKDEVTTTIRKISKEYTETDREGE